MKKTKIVCTIGPVTGQEEFLEKLLDAGMKQSSIDQMLITNPEIVFSESK